MEVDSLVVAVIIGRVRVNVVVNVAVRVVALGFVVESLADLVSQYQIVPVFDA